MGDGVCVVDLDDTLISDRVAVRAAIGETLRAIGVAAATPDAVQLVLDCAREGWRTTSVARSKAMTGVSSWEALWTDFERCDICAEHRTEGAEFKVQIWSAVLGRVLQGGADIDPYVASSLFSQVRRDRVAPLDGAVNLLREISASDSIWVVSHGSTGLQSEKLELSGLSELIERCYFSGDLGMLKSSSEFLKLLEYDLLAVGMKVDLVIGDSSSDMQLAFNGGWRGVHLQSGEPNGVLCPGHAHADSLTTCRDLVRKLGVGEGA